jgi:hypothetical protein
MKTKKINLSNFTGSVLIARLLVIDRNISFKYDELIKAGKDEFMKEVENIVKANFIYPKKNEESIINNLALHILGNKENTFDKTLNL